jgi:hypothetical protein
MGEKQFERIGEYEGRLRGLSGGRFLATLPHGFAIYDMA